MKKAFRRLVSFAFLLLAGFFLFQSDFLEEKVFPQIQEYATSLLQKVKQDPPVQLQPPVLPAESDLAETDAADAADDSASSPSISFVPAGEFQPPPESIDEEEIRSEIFRLTNDLREEKGLVLLKQDAQLEQAANIRAAETEESFSHTRPDGREFYTVLKEKELDYSYLLAGENLAMATHHLSDLEMADFLFHGWMESEGHYKNMIEPDYQEIGIGVYYDGEFLYLVQIFGKPY